MKVLRAVSALMIALGIAFIGIGMASAGDGGAQNRLDRAISGGGIVRLHIIADDDSDAAQAVKLRVRDAIIAAYGARLRALADKDEALELSERRTGEDRTAVKRGAARKRHGLLRTRRASASTTSQTGSTTARWCPRCGTEDKAG